MASAAGLLDAPHTRTVEEVLAFYSSSLATGLTNAQVARQAERFGKNELEADEGKTLMQLILAQFDDLLVKILLASAVISFILAYFDEGQEKESAWIAYVEPLVILLILIANAFVGVWQESNAEKALEALKKLQSETAMVLRNGSWHLIEAADLVPGDIVEVRVGDRVPADIRMAQLKTTTIRIEQSQLTGESQSVTKDVEPVTEHGCVVQAKSNILFSSTTVANGACFGIVVGIGMQTEIGKIQSAVKAAAEEEENTPLQKKLDEFGELLAKVIFVICAIVWIINYKHFFDPIHGSVLRGCIYYFKIAVALAVAAIPEGLPAVITTCLALGTRKMAQKNAVVRKLPSVETLGCTTVICSDKTGTLTTNEMCCVRFCMPEGPEGSMKSYPVRGHSYAPVGEIVGLEQGITEDDRGLQMLAKIACMCNDSRLDYQDGRYARTGEPTEAAIRVLVEKLGCPDPCLKARYLQVENRARDDAMAFSKYWSSSINKLAQLEFTRDRKSMSVICKEKSSPGNVMFVKGAPESIIERSTQLMLPNGSIVSFTSKAKAQVKVAVDSMAKDALRTLAMACKSDLGSLRDYNGPSHPEHKQFNDPAYFVELEKSLTFVGIVGIVDPPRPECKEAIRNCRVAGMSVIMITGDNKLTAEAISTELGILQCSENSEGRSFTGQEFEALTDEEKVNCLRKIMEHKDVEGAVFSRTEPRHKQIIVKILKQLGEVCAMTGDGVNDAPALKQADIGVAMGIAGTEVAKEASDMVLTDDNFSTVVAAVEEGRSIYNNMKAFIRYLISSNIGEVASIFFTAALGIPEGLAPVQLLWVNLVTDGLPATALGFNPPDLDVMQKPPRNRDDNLISSWVFFRYMMIGLYVGVATVGIFMYWYVLDESNPDGHTLVTVEQLMSWGQCSTWKDFNPNDFYNLSFEKNPCSYFTKGKVKASSLSLTVLVVIEMLNALNALSEDGSLLQMAPWTNPWLTLAVMGSVVVHFTILYIPILCKIFVVCPLDWHDWQLVLAFSMPVILLDEILKFFGRLTAASRLAHFKRCD